MLNRTNLLRVAGVVLLAGSAWFAASTVALAQSQGARSDSAIQQDVMSAFGQDSSLQGQSISASANKGVVTLTGSVQTEADRQAAETDASNVTGVSGIIDHLTVSNPNSSASSAGLAAQTSANQVSPEDQSQDNQPESQAEPQEQQEQPQQGAVPPPPPDQTQTQPSYEPNQAPPPPQPYGAPPPPQTNGAPPPYQQGYAPAPRIPYYQTPTAPVTIPAGTLLRVRLSEPLDTAHLRNGTIFHVTNAVDVYENGVLAIPRGATLTGRVVETQNGGKDKLSGSAVLALQLTDLNLAGKIFPLNTAVWSSRGPNKAGYTARNTAGGAILGAIIGGIIGRGAGAAVGAGVGAVGGLAASSATSGPRIYLPVEALVDFHLATPVTVQPVSWQEAQRLASSVPALVQRPRPPVYMAPGPYYRPYPYPY